MKAPKTIIYLFGIYCIISGAIYIAISIFSICAYACAFDFTGSPLTYVMYLLYFRRTSCHRSIDWDLLKIEHFSTASTPEIPPVTSFVIRTLVFSIFYLILNVAMIITAFRAMAGIKMGSKDRYGLFWSYYAALLIVFITIIVIDFICSGFYLVEYCLLVYSSHNIISFLEISNKDEFLVTFSKLSTSTRSVPSLIFFLLSSKFIIFLTINVAATYLYFDSVWKVCRDAQKQVFDVNTDSPKKAPSPNMSLKSFENIHGTLHRTNTTQDIQPEVNQQQAIPSNINYSNRSSLASTTNADDIDTSLGDHMYLSRISNEKF